MKDYFEVLDIGEDTGEQAIKNAYRMMLIKYPAGRYPEKNREIEEAYRMLCNPATKNACIEFHRMGQPSKQAYRQASDAMSDGRFAEAAKILEKAVEHEKHATHLNYLLGVAYLNLKKPSRAVKALEPVRDEYPCDVKLNTLFIKACLDSRKYKKAVMRAEECLAINSDNYLLVHLLTEGYMQLGKFGEAIVLLIDAFNNAAFEERRHNICMKLTYIYFLDENIDNCLKWMDKLTGLPADDEEKEDSAELIIDMLYRFVETHMLYQARKCAGVILELTPGREDVAEIKSSLDDLLRIKPEIDSFDNDGFIPDLLKVYVANGVFSNWTKELSEEKQAAYSVLLEYQILSEYSDFLMALRYMKNKYPYLYELKADFFDALQDARERRKLTNRNKAMFYQYHDVISELMDELEDEYDDEDDWDGDGWDEDDYDGYDYCDHYDDDDDDDDDDDSDNDDDDGSDDCDEDDYEYYDNYEDDLEEDEEDEEDEDDYYDDYGEEDEDGVDEDGVDEDGVDEDGVEEDGDWDDDFDEDNKDGEDDG